MVFSSTIRPASEPWATATVDADGLAPPDEAPAPGLGVGLTALARADELAGATLAEGAATLAEGGAPVAEGAAPVAEAAAWVAEAAACVAAEVDKAAGADEAIGPEELAAGVAEWVVAVQAAVIRTGTVTRTAIATRRGRGGTCTEVILADRPPV
jgi:hypothetical protein